MERSFKIAPWHISTDVLNTKERRIQESITSLGNGYMGMRGFFEEDYSGDSLSGIYLGGIWYPDKTKVGWWKNGYPDYFGKVINTINFIKMRIFINGQPLDLFKDKIKNFNLDLNMHNGLLTRSFVVEKNGQSVEFKFERFLSIVTKELAAIRIVAKNLTKSTIDLKIESYIDADVTNEDANYDEHFWQVISKKTDKNSSQMLAITKENPFGTPRFTVGIAADYQGTFFAKSSNDEISSAAINNFASELAPLANSLFEKRILVVTSRDYSTELQIKKRLNELDGLTSQKSFDQLLDEQSNAWNERWKKSDIQVVGNDEAQQGIRFNLFQLFSTYYGDDSRLNIGPKGFTGEKYGGATYWDTEAFVLPVYLGSSDPSVAKNLLLYRYNQLPGAYHNAAQQGLKGALFPMVTFDGVEYHNEWEITFEEIHRNGDIAFAIYNYTRYTGDEDYLLHQGSKVLVEISRFWADRVHFSQQKQQYMIHGVTGADEYENNVDNNWYTNYLAKWTLQYTLKTLNKVSKKQADNLNVSQIEKNNWQIIAEKMYLPYDQKLDIFVQHDGFLDKELKPASTIPSDQLPINQHWSWDKILRSPYIKQADVLQNIWYFIDDFTFKQKKHNFDFYEPLTVHESSLSPSIHAILAADLHFEDKATELYARTARLDLDNYNHDTQDGLHITSMAGGWLAIVQGFAGMRIRKGQLHFAPFIPKKWSGYSFRLLFRGSLIEVVVNQTGSHYYLIEGPSIVIENFDQKIKVIKKDHES
ncbi:glycoside hydrolase family 65 protein [Oenococcus sicerae]|uniref:Glycoside hydrolase family 65 protein n=1 Tax=Oenococcus sicerae TaxID=2203724 RepID=A0AAJ1R8M5_9LACO|nr:glycoside hydrolase family 65 protein [Oenococcus sicerae]MDN6900179.1 glycoside hydrolase family 65 protein [Oenococcus sicerae]